MKIYYSFSEYPSELYDIEIEDIYNLNEIIDKVSKNASMNGLVYVYREIGELPLFKFEVVLVKFKDLYDES